MTNGIQERFFNENDRSDSIPRIWIVFFIFTSLCLCSFCFPEAGSERTWAVPLAKPQKAPSQALSPDSRTGKALAPTMPGSHHRVLPRNYVKAPRVARFRENFSRIRREIRALKASEWAVLPRFEIWLDDFAVGFPASGKH
jgi:hypothetical protein